MVKAAGSRCRVVISPVTVQARSGFGMVSVAAIEAAESRMSATFARSLSTYFPGLLKVSMSRRTW